MGGFWGTTPRESVEAECQRRGLEEVLLACVALLERRPVDDALIVAIGGPHGENVLGGLDGGPEGYWPRVWAARALLYVWGDEATEAILAATGDESWRVREQVAKVVARHRLGEALDAMAKLRADPVARVRLAAERAVVRITEAGA